ncbi:UDP-N-acetylmuramoyl-L-alanyl-D-glutamate--2,6-diaminopimelate ligase [Arthrobacter sp. UM1]|uniref:UDP-N-acetylmuramoyl-L-alanyl-D-glutamate--2, 6-diaminopimelate ligase n=1 Tax=Arthrobacter sp. UM1 TaxID=2766776 RepID=UPI001CF67CF5|nr:UDP-N-acetylmuramoyl-L-alanyl-D-glutamate--2,6-diaminopimelate ligase [Arthrobacter sp. UM1]
MRPRSARERSAAEAVDAVARRLGLAAEHSETSARVTGVTMDSRDVCAGDLYCAVPGARRHGAEFTAQVLAAGASAVVTDAAGEAAVRAAVDSAGAEAAVFTVEDPVRAWVGPLAAEVYGTQERSFPLFAVTGTNGKTTTTYMLNGIQRALGRRTGIIGTIEIDAGGEPIPSVLTTPESTNVHGILARMGENGVTGAAMEVSSHAIDYRRVDGIRFDVAGFTNLTQDHLDLHGTMDAYFASKADLFTERRTRRAVVLADEDWGRRMAEHARSHGVETLTLSLDGAENADIEVTDIEQVGLGFRFTVAFRGDRLEASLPLPGDFNVANAALAIGMVLASGVPAEDLRGPLADGSALSVTVPGRMQVIGTEPAAIVDFAHNPDALVRALTSVAGRRTILVVGATGDRDATKRGTMGRIAAELADVVIVTDDDPHGEDPARIRAAVLEGARSADSDAEVLEVFPRDEAIRRAVALASREDTIVVAGRGHETVQEVAGVDVPLDDRVELAAALTARGFRVADQAAETAAHIPSEERA